MCGFVGYIEQQKRKNNKDIIKNMTDKIIHRGPDSEGYHTDLESGFGFRRLSIIDLDNGSQPIFSEDGKKFILFNGEIYNFQTIKDDLIKKGYKFKTNTDTEVILNGYIEYGESILDKLRGMFAFIIYDIEQKELFGARDFYGIKPFYYYNSNDVFIFGSEIKSFLEHPNFKKELNRGLLENYLIFQFTPGTETFFKNVFKLAPGHYFKYRDGYMEITKYYSVKFEQNRNKTTEEWKNEIKLALEKSVEMHKISDVQIGSFLSSGVDSSYLAAMSKVDKTFSVDFHNKKYSEIDYAKELSDKIGAENYSKLLTKEEYFKNIPKIMYHMDEPLADPSAIALYFVANVASEHVKVSFSGEGSDEAFGGYQIYTEQYRMAKYDRIPFFIRYGIGKFAYLFPAKKGFNFLVRRGKKIEDRYIGGSTLFQNKEIKRLIKYKSDYPRFNKLTKPFYDEVKGKDDVTKMQYIDFNFWLVSDILLKADKMSMANSLEVRVPFLDRDVIDLAATLPTYEKVDKINTKKIFREVAKEVLPDKFAFKKKLGFPVPIREWLREDEIYSHVKETILSEKEFFNEKYVMKLLENHYNEKEDNMRKIWTLYTFTIWYKTYFK